MDKWFGDLSEKLEKHKYALVSEDRKCTTYDAYGNEDSTFLERDFPVKVELIQTELLEMNDSICQSGLGYFWRYVLLEDPYNGKHFFDGWLSYLKTYKPMDHSNTSRLGRDDWYLFVAMERIQYTIQVEIDQDSYAVEEMTGEEYELLCKSLLEDQGLEVIKNGKSGDQGVDLIAIAENVRFCIQCKRYSKPVGNRAVQQVLAGKRFHSGTHAAVVTNAGFTASARELAAASEVLLLSTEQLAGLVEDDEDEEISPNS